MCVRGGGGGGPTCVERGGGGRAIGIVKQTLKPRIVGVGVGTWNLERRGGHCVELGVDSGGGCWNLERRGGETLRGTWRGDLK